MTLAAWDGRTARLRRPALRVRLGVEARDGHTPPNRSNPTAQREREPGFHAGVGHPQQERPHPMRATGTLPYTAIGATLFAFLLSYTTPSWSQEKKDAKPEAKKDAKPELKKDEKKDAKPEATKDAKPEANKDAKPEAKKDAKPEAKKDAKPEAKKDAKPEVKKAAAPAPAPDDPAKLKATIAALQKEVAELKQKITSMEFEKIGARISVDKVKDGSEITTVNILKLWAGDKDGLARLKELPNVQVVYVDNGQFNDSAVAILKDLSGLNSLTLMSPQVTDAALDSVKALANLNMLFLTNSKVSDAGLSKLKDLKNLKVLALSRTQVTDKGLDSLKEIKGLKSVYLIGTKVTDGGVKKLKESLPELVVYR
jgi:hypothetical protein